MKYILLALVSVLTLAAISLFLMDLFDNSAAESEQEVLVQSVPEVDPVSGVGPEPELPVQADSSFGEAEKPGIQPCAEPFEKTILELMEGPQFCERHEDCQLKRFGEGCDTYIARHLF